MEKNIFQDLKLEETLLKIQIRQQKEVVKNIKKTCGWYGPSEVSGIDYSKDGTSQIVRVSFDEALEKIKKEEEKIKELQERKRSISGKIKTLKVVYGSLRGSEAKVYYERKVLQNTQVDAAENIGMSVRQLQRIEKKLKNNGML